MIKDDNQKKYETIDEHIMQAVIEYMASTGEPFNTRAREYIHLRSPLEERLHWMEYFLEKRKEYEKKK